MPVMCRESRKIWAFLDSCILKYNIQYLISPNELYLTDLLVIQYYTPVIINLLTSRIKSVRSISNKHGTMEYWYSVMSNMLKNNQSAIRDTPAIPDSHALSSFIHWIIVSNYLLVDYSIQDAQMIIQIASTYSCEEVEYAVSIGKSNKVYEVRYIHAILEKERAKKTIVDTQRQHLQDTIDSSNRLLTNEIHHHTPLDIAQAMYNWDKSKENILIEQEFNKFINDRS